jgi:hypothetical protein
MGLNTSVNGFRNVSGHFVPFLRGIVSFMHFPHRAKSIAFSVTRNQMEVDMKDRLSGDFPIIINDIKSNGLERLF